MIIKGGSRAAPSQLARHLQRRDTNEMVDVLELQSPAPNLEEALRDWQILSEGTLGTKGLYHVNIDPAKEYVMSPEQWRRCVEILEKELGLQGQPRAVVLHEKEGRQHIHVVWARTDIDTMTLRSDSMNYPAHERASKALELEFGHEMVPGKHAKRDREKQPEFPNAAVNHAEWQQAERTGVNPAERKDQITALKQASDNAEAFKAALEQQGYILAQGDRRNFVIVDQAGEVYGLTRQIHGMKAADLREFMKGIDPQTLPSVAQAKENWKEMRKQTEAPVPAEPATKTPELAPDPVQTQREAEAEAFRKAVAARLEEETRQLVESHAAKLAELRRALDIETKEKLARYDAIHREEVEARATFINSMRKVFSPARAAQREAAFRRQQAQERAAYAATLEQIKELEIGNLTERHALQLQDRATSADDDIERYMREQETARKLQAEVEERERELEQERTRGPEWPPPPVR